MGGEGNIPGGPGFRSDHRRVVEQALARSSPLDEAIDDLSGRQRSSVAVAETPEARRQRLEADRAKLGSFLAEQSFLDVAETTLKAALDAGIQDFMYGGKQYKIPVLLAQITDVYAFAVSDVNVSGPIRKAAGIYLQQHVGKAR